MNPMQVVLLILSVLGQPERIGAISAGPNAEKLCNDAGQSAQKLYTEQFHQEPKNFSYRCIPAVIIREQQT